ncbi:hypothetical protein CALCODRAFT_45402 [Calocera cornea HHB12733]|uniref:Uncharacterized protein n=1 Tax=Calocera cornea HHB12733 TaxID=1353952 RepID=A0A165IYK9_9BASI|nr:hypothetical protein CALCODRAFT_45402 [Calocera cornea HHB12733]
MFCIQLTQLSNLHRDYLWPALYYHSPVGTYGIGAPLTSFYAIAPHRCTLQHMLAEVLIHDRLRIVPALSG